MKRTVRLAILGAMLHGSAHADEQSETAKPALDKAQKNVTVVQQKTVASKKAKTTRGKKMSAKVKPDPILKQNQDATTETAPDSIEQSVHLKGVRG